MGKKDRVGWVLGGILVVGLVLRIGFILTLDNSVDVWGDWWDELGWRLAQGHGFWVTNPFWSEGPRFLSWRPPAFPFFLSLVYRLAGHSYLAAKIVLALISALTALAVYSVGRRLGDRRLGLAAGAIFAAYPPAIFWTGYLAPETLCTLLLTTAALCLLEGSENPRPLWFFLGGLVLGAGVLTRSLFLLLIPSVGVWLWLTRQPCRQLRFLLCCLGCALVVSPWTFRNWRVHHRFVLTSTEGGIVCYIANNENSLSSPSGYWDPGPDYPVEVRSLSEVDADRFFYRKAFDFIRTHPAVYLRLVGDRFLRFWRLFPHTFSGPGESYRRIYVWGSVAVLVPLFVLALWGFVLSLREWRRFFLIYAVIVTWSVPVILFFKVVIRYREPAMPLMILFASTAILRIARPHER